MDEAKRLAKNAKTSASIKATKAKRQQQTCKVFTLKINHRKLSAKQKEALQRVFLEAKWLRNTIIASEDAYQYKLTNQAQVKLKDGTLETRQLSALGGHLRQAIHKEVLDNIASLSALKKNGHKVGRLKFAKQVSSINLKEHGRTYQIKGNKIQVQKLGWMRASGIEQLNGYELANAKLLAKPDGYYLAVTAYKYKHEIPQSFQPNTVIGLDMGVATHITLSDGSKINILVKETDQLKRLQRKLSRQTKGSNRYEKTKLAIRKEYQRMSNKKADAANKIVHELLKHELIFMQDEQIASWKKRNKYVRGGKRLQHSVLGRVKAKLAASEQVVVLRRNAPTTKLCRCGVKNPHQLNERLYFCGQCGYSEDRDVHAAQNMVRLGVGYKSFNPMEHRFVERVPDWKSSDFQLHAVKREASGSLFCSRKTCIT